MSVLAIAAFIEALMDNCFKFEKCISFYVEQVEYCYETGPFSAGLPDRNFHRLIWIKSPGTECTLYTVTQCIQEHIHTWEQLTILKRGWYTVLLML